MRVWEELKGGSFCVSGIGTITGLHSETTDMNISGEEGGAEGPCA